MKDIHAGTRTKLVDFIVQRAFYPVLIVDRSGPHRAMIERMRAIAFDAIDRYRTYQSTEEVIDAFQRDIASKAVLAHQSELRLLQLPVLGDFRDDFDRKARDLGFKPDTLLTSLCSPSQGHAIMDQERVSERAYALWEKAGQPDGAHDQHWQQACREIEGEDGAPMPATTAAAETLPASATHRMVEADDQRRPARPETTKRS